KYGAKYIGDFCLKTKDKGWSEQPAAIFYQENPDVSLGHTHYFGLLIRDGCIFITKGDSAFEQGLTGIQHGDEIIVSCFRHDYVKSHDGEVFVDGGRDYLRTNSSNIVKLHIEKDKLVLDENMLP